MFFNMNYLNDYFYWVYGVYGVYSATKKIKHIRKPQMTNWTENHSARDVFHWLQVFHFRGSATRGERQHYDPRCFRRQAETFPALCVYEEKVWAVSLLVFTDTCEEKQEEEQRLETLPQHPFPICPLLYPLLSLWALSLSSFFMPQSAARGNMFLMSVPPSSVPGVLFTFTNSALWLSLVISVNVHFNSTAFDVPEQLIKETIIQKAEYALNFILNMRLKVNCNLAFRALRSFFELPISKRDKDKIIFIWIFTDISIMSLSQMKKKM